MRWFGHIAEEHLALFAGNDLPRLQSWWVERHVDRCATCREAVTAHSEIRSAWVREKPVPRVNWSSLEAEMRANIRLGLAAAECVGNEPRRRPARSSLAAIAVGMALVLVCAMAFGWRMRLLRPPVDSAADNEATVEVTAAGMQVRQGREALQMLTRHSRQSGTVVNASGEARATIYNPETGILTINHVSLQ